MTRGYIIFTKDGKTANAVGYISSDGYPSGFGLELLDAIEKGMPEEAIIEMVASGYPEDADGNVCPMNEFDEATPITGIKLADWSVDYIYVLNTKTKKLWVRNYGTLLYTFDLRTQMDVCRAIFKRDFILYIQASIDPDTLYNKDGRAKKELRQMAKSIKSEAELFELINNGPKVRISAEGKYCPFGVGDDIPFEYRYSVAVLTGEGENAGWDYSSFPLALIPNKRRYWEKYENVKRFNAVLTTPCGRVYLKTPYTRGAGNTLSKRAGERFFTEWVKTNLETLCGYVPVFKAIQAAKHELSSIEKQPGITCDVAGEEARKIVTACMAEITPFFDTMKNLPELPLNSIREHFQGEVRDIVWRLASKD